MTWWGEPWPTAEMRAPVCMDDAERVEVPVGQRCVLCTEVIAAGDRGVVMGAVRLGDDGTPVASSEPVHAECNLRNVTGNHLHVAGGCRFVGDCNTRSDLSYRQEALEVWRMYAEIE